MGIHEEDKAETKLTPYSGMESFGTEKMSEILIIYSTTDGHTLEICQRLKQVIEQQHHRARLISIDDEKNVNLALYDKIIIGASIRYGKHNRSVYEFVNRNEQTLDAKPNAFFSVNLVARKPEKSQPETNPYLRTFLKQISWQPKELAVFAGKIDYPRYSLGDRLMIQMIMWMTKGPTNREAVIDFTDWKHVDKFGLHICEI